MPDLVTTLKRIVIGTRTSPLALVQTEEFARALRELYPDLELITVPITTDGDRHKDSPLLSMGRGMFVKEIELALLNGEIDVAVHSAKDLPAFMPDGLTIAAFPERQDPRDIIVNKWNLPLMELPPGARLGTSSPRRTAQIKAVRPDVEILSIRGNVGTRMDKAKSGDYDGVVLAAAGLVRLGRQNEISEYLSTDICTPDVGQGALAIQARADNAEVIEILSSVDHAPTSVAVRCERAFLSTLGGGCKVPVAAYAELYGDELRIEAMAALPDGSSMVRKRLTYDAGDPEFAGKRVAEVLIDAGAKNFITEDEAV